jgi:hypothetical protein
VTYTVLAVGKDADLDGVFAYGPYRSADKARGVYDLLRDPFSALWKDPKKYDVYEPRQLGQP